MVRPLVCDQLMRHGSRPASLAKYAAAFTSRRSRTIAACPSRVMPGRAPSSISAWRTHLRNVCACTPSRQAVSAIDNLPPGKAGSPPPETRAGTSIVAPSRCPSPLTSPPTIKAPTESGQAQPERRASASNSPSSKNGEPAPDAVRTPVGGRCRLGFALPISSTARPPSTSPGIWCSHSLPIRGPRSGTGPTNRRGRGGSSEISCHGRPARPGHERRRVRAPSRPAERLRSSRPTRGGRRD